MPSSHDCALLSDDVYIKRAYISRALRTILYNNNIIIITRHNVKHISNDNNNIILYSYLSILFT